PPRGSVFRTVGDRFVPSAISGENRFAWPTTRLVDASNSRYARWSLSWLGLALERAARAVSSTRRFTLRLRSRSLAPTSPAIFVIFLMGRVSTRTPSPNRLLSVG